MREGQIYVACIMWMNKITKFSSTIVGSQETVTKLINQKNTFVFRNREEYWKQLMWRKGGTLQFPAAAAYKLPQTWWLKIREICSLIVLEARSRKSVAPPYHQTSSRIPLPPGPTRGFTSLLLPGSDGCGIPWLVDASMPSWMLSSHWLLLCVKFPSTSPILRTAEMAHRDHVYNLGLSPHLKILDMILSAKTFSPNRVV